MSWDPGEPGTPQPLYEPPAAELPPMEGPVRRPRSGLKRLGSLIAGAGLVLGKFLWPVLIALKNLKFLATGATFFISVLAYATLWGWRFALGFTLLILVHEMGHVIQLRREGVPATAPLFIPFFGAFVGMKQLPESAWAEAKVGLAGPVLGTVGAAGCLAAGIFADSEMMRALAYTGFLLNLINLIPVLPLDGGRAAAAFHPAFWFVGLFAIVLLFLVHHSLILLMIAILGGFELYHRWNHRADPASQAYHRVSWGQRIAVGLIYVGLVAVLVLGMDAAYLHKTL